MIDALDRCDESGECRCARCETYVCACVADAYDHNLADLDEAARILAELRTTIRSVLDQLEAL